MSRQEGGIAVQWIEGGISGDPFSGTDRRGTLTTEHAASSYGLPVLVAEDGTVLGPAECGAVLELVYPPPIVDISHVCEPAVRAGYRVAVLGTEVRYRD